MADADDVVDAVRAGRDEDGAAAAGAGGGQGAVDRGGGVGGVVGLGAVVRTLATTGWWGAGSFGGRCRALGWGWLPLLGLSR